MKSQEESADVDVPLCVDLDGTLLRTDLLWETLFDFLHHHPRRFPEVLVWLAKGKAHLKKRLAENTSLDVSLLPVNQPLVEWLQGQKSAGRRLILATAADELPARRVAARFGFFDEVLASDGASNLKGRNKAVLLTSKYGGAFDYAGNAASDWEIWRVCRRIIAVDTPRWMTRRLQHSGRLASISIMPGNRVAVWSRALRVRQWTKNVLIFVPLIAAHKASDMQRLEPALVCFLAFCLTASATYLFNDLLDLAADRVHPHNKHRPLAAGDLSIAPAAAASVALFAAGITLAALAATRMVTALVVLYALASVAYSLRLKKTALLDVYLLSGFYTLRILAGGIAGNVPLSGWFLSFSVFLFLSLGFAKRAAELHRLAGAASPGVPERGYAATDFQPVMCFGIASAFAASLVLCLYLQSTEVQALYRHPVLLWALFPICLYWLTRVWLLASRGILREDPVGFAIADRTTWCLVAVFAIILRMAA
jgi:4-hydroxybenzoate polyprenyltransferase/phosphoserine phosphatase